MTSRFSEGLSTRSENTGICCGPVSMASYMCFSLTPLSEGANLPRGSAPPAAAKLWQAVQFVRQNCPPLETADESTPAVSYSDLSGTAGPGPRDATYAASALISSGE